MFPKEHTVYSGRRLGLCKQDDPSMFFHLRILARRPKIKQGQRVQLGGPGSRFRLNHALSMTGSLSQCWAKVFIMGFLTFG